jgi:hypothetical protein
MLNARDPQTLEGETVHIDYFSDWEEVKIVSGD